MANKSTEDLVRQARYATGSTNSQRISDYLKDKGYSNVPNAWRISRILRGIQ